MIFILCSVIGALATYRLTTYVLCGRGLRKPLIPTIFVVLATSWVNPASFLLGLVCGLLRGMTRRRRI